MTYVHASGSHLGPPEKLNHVPSLRHTASPVLPAPLAATKLGRSPLILAPTASSDRSSRTNHDSVQPVGEGSGLALSAPAKRAPHRARPQNTKPAPHASHCHRIATPQVIVVCTHSARRPPQPGLLIPPALSLAAPYKKPYLTGPSSRSDCGAKPSPTWSPLVEPRLLRSPTAAPTAARDAHQSRVAWHAPHPLLPSVRGCEWGSSPLGGSLYSLLNKSNPAMDGCKSGRSSRFNTYKSIFYY